MTDAAAWLVALPFAALSIPSLVLLAQAGLAWPSRRRFADVSSGRSPRNPSGADASNEPTERDDDIPPIAVLMPAHDEASGIAASIATLLPQLRPQDRLLVVADNCSDETAIVSRRAGAEVTERTDTARRGKGYALDHGIRVLAASPPGVVVVVDADCAVADGSLRHLAARCAITRRPAQALYLMRSVPGTGLKGRIAEFAWRVRNLVRPLGWSRIGLPCQLTGSGMAVPWARIESAVLAHADLVEDMRLGLDLAAAGAPPLFCPSALVTSVFPIAAADQATQRIRWEHGHLTTIARCAPILLWRSLTHADPRLLAMVLDLCVPPLAALVLADALASLVAVALWAGGAGLLPLGLSSVSLAALAAAVLLAWHGFGRDVSLRDLCAVPGYVLAKLPLYLRWFGRRQSGWVRTGRGDDPA